MSKSTQPEHLSLPDLAASLVEERGSVEAQTVAVICPSPGLVLAPRPMRHAPCCVLMRLKSGLVFMLRTVGHVWTEQRLAVAADLLSRDSSDILAIGDPSLPTRLAYAVEIPHVQVLNPALDRPDPEQWGTRKLALGLRMQFLSPADRLPEAAVLANEVEAIETALTSRLRAALARFVEALDRDVLSATPAGVNGIDAYNYLVNAAHRHYRLQGARTFPIFVHAASSGEPDSAGGLIRHTIDSGLPLVRTLAKEWAVSPSVLRGLRGLPVEVVGEHWQSNIEGLVAARNALPAELRPDASPSSWETFNRHVGFAESVFGRRPWTSPLALSWLRHAARHGWSAGDSEQRAEPLRPESVALVDELRQALIDTVKSGCTGAGVSHAAEASLAARVWHGVDGHLARMAPRRLVQLADRYRRELSAARVELASRIAVAYGARFWPLLEGEYLSSDRSRVVVPLESRQQLLEHGRALENCLGSATVDHFAAACAAGETFIVALLDAASRAPLSTVEVRVKRPNLTGRQEIRVVQHTAARNLPPSPQCRAALQEVVSLLGTEGAQQHLRDGFKALATRRRGDLVARREADMLPVRLAVRRTLGEQRYHALLVQLQEGNQPG